MNTWLAVYNDSKISNDKIWMPATSTFLISVLQDVVYEEIYQALPTSISSIGTSFLTSKGMLVDFVCRAARLETPSDPSVPLRWPLAWCPDKKLMLCKHAKQNNFVTVLSNVAIFQSSSKMSLSKPSLLTLSPKCHQPRRS